MTCRCESEKHNYPLTPDQIDQTGDCAVEIYVCLECGAQRMRVFPNRPDEQLPRDYE
jgi:hypothetical protein